MKRCLIAIFAMFVNVAAFAGSPLTVVKSNVPMKQLMAEKVDANLTIDWSKAKYDNSQKASGKLGKDYEFVKKDCAAKFIEGFNAKSKGINLGTANKNAKYLFQLRVDNLDSFVNVMGFGSRTEAKMWGVLKIVEKKTGKVLAEIKIDEAEDGTDYVFREAFGKTFLLLGAGVAKLKK
ncbi:MAG: hypothetical protein IKR52_00325 [Paludibacteraceae bacterium]|nr:hypothetical protein [Paludibacteraceae bacterium]